ncbi:MAG: sulfatase [Roseibacillus sp.]
MAQQSTILKPATHAFKELSLILSFILLAGFGSSIASARESQPNIIFIMADDLGWQDVGFMGSGYFETPHLDALAKESLVFEQAYMYPTCSPSRSALLTGQQSFRTGSYCVPVLEKGKAQDNIFSKWTITKEHPLYSEPLSRAGYRLIHLGKWHIVGPHPKAENNLPFKRPLKQPRNGDLSWLPAHRAPEIAQYYPTGRGFHRNVGGTWWGDPARGLQKGYNDPKGGYITPFENPFIKEEEGDEWLTDRLTSEAIRFMKENQDSPFFINLHYYAPHRPSVARSEESLQYFKKKKADPATGQDSQKKPEIAAYATMVQSLDENVKRIIDYLDEADLRKNTIIFFTSDNGHNGLQSMTKNLRAAKGSVYEGGLRVPALVNWPGTVAPSRSKEMIQGLDYFPTFLELAGITDFEGTLDGKSIVPLLTEEPFVERSLFWHLPSTYKNPPSSIIRKGDWKLIQFLKGGKLELYSLKDDLKESKNLATSHPEVAQELLEELTNWRRTHSAPLPPSSKLDF